jgi:peptide/nickel transport system substrate-binding protein
LTTRRTALQLLGGLGGVGLLAACAPSPGAAPTPATAPPSAPAAVPATAPASSGGTATQAPGKPAGEQPRAGGTLRVGLASEPANLDPHLVGGTSVATSWHAFDTLTAYDSQLQPQPMLAERFEVSPDYKQVKLSLRPGVTFHNGKELDSEIVKWNILRVRDPKVGSASLALQSNWFTDIQTPDKHTLVLTSEQPRPALFDFFEYLNISDREVLEGPEARSKIVGTGPFAFAEWLQGNRLRLVKNRSYCQSGKPYLDEVVFTFVSDAQSNVVQLEAGTLDVLDNPSARDAQRFEKDPRYRVYADDLGNGYLILTTNTGIAPTDNKVVRQALGYAVDRKRIVDSVLLGGEPRSLPWPPQSLAYEANKANHYTFDLDRAAALFKQAGVEGAELELIYQSTLADGSALGQILQSDLGKVGIKLTLRGLESGGWRDQVDNARYRGLNIATSTFAALEPSSLFALSRAWNPAGNSSAFKSDRYVQLVNTASGEPDAARRKQIYAELNDFMLDEAFNITVASTRTLTPLNDRVKGYTRRVNGVATFGDVWLSA